MELTQHAQTRFDVWVNDPESLHTLHNKSSKLRYGQRLFGELQNVHAGSPMKWKNLKDLKDELMSQAFMATRICCTLKKPSLNSLFGEINVHR